MGRAFSLGLLLASRHHGHISEGWEQSGAEGFTSQRMRLMIFRPFLS